MNPDTKLILEEFSKRFDALEVKWESRFSVQDESWGRKFSDLEAAHGDRLSKLEEATGALPSIEGTVDDIRLEVNKLSKHWERAVFDRATNEPLRPTPPAPERLPFPGFAGRPNGHCVDQSHREADHGVVTTMSHLPVKGAYSEPQFSHADRRSSIVSEPRGEGARGNYSKWPKIDFPWFDGENPKLWLKRCEDYFDFCCIEPSMWVRLSSMHFSEPASRWLQSVEKKLKSSTWYEFCSMVLDRFGRDQHELLVRQLFHIKQTTTVLEYIDRFAVLVDQLAAYEDNVDPLHYTMKFVDGLRDDVRSAVLLHRPSTLDTAYVLAQLQEEVAGSIRKPELKKPDFSYHARSSPRSPMPLPPPPGKISRSPVAEDRKPPDPGKTKTADDRWRALRAFRRAKGLCQFCAEKWSRDHKCADSIQLHAIQEVFDLFHSEDDGESAAGDSVHHSEHLFCTLSEAAVSGVPSPKTMCMLGTIQGHSVTILVDSGSSNSFLGKHIASQLSGISTAPVPVMVQVANGEKLISDSLLQQALWMVGEVSFVSDLKVLPLSSYDMIVGMDWLELFSPMKVHWKQKWLSIPYQGSTVTLHGIHYEVPVGTVVQVCNLDIVASHDSVSISCPPEIQQLLEDFAVLFQVPSELPPSRTCGGGCSPCASKALPVCPGIKR